jgi:hypothetical protein
MPSKMVVFVHGWSVRSTDTYGKLPDRLKAEASAAGIELDVNHVYLSKYVSFRDEVRVEDIARGIETAIKAEPAIRTAVDAGTKLIIITHSTGGPVAREWWYRFYVKTKQVCPMSHLIMLAPANFGSALAQLGKSTISRLKSWTESVQPGQGVLDWLELGSSASWDLNEAWIRQQPAWANENPVYQFVLTGQKIDRAMYDYVNSYTGETGSDGVVRVTSANLNATYVKLVQRRADTTVLERDWRQTTLAVSGGVRKAPPTALAVLLGMAHSGKDIGIMRSVKMSGDHVTVNAILECLTVTNAATYSRVVERFQQMTNETQAAEREEKEDWLLFENTRIHPKTTQVIVRVSDDSGYPLRDMDVLLTAWDPGHANPEFQTPSANQLPKGFLLDVQRNKVTPNCLTFYLNYEELQKAKGLGIQINPRPTPELKARPKDDFFVHYLPGAFGTDRKNLSDILLPNQTLLVDIVMLRVVRSGIFRVTTDTAAKDFTGDSPDGMI